MERSEFFSQEEYDFYWWCLSLQSIGAIIEFSYDQLKYELFDGAKVKTIDGKTKSLSKIRYTPDFVIKPNKVHKLFCKCFGELVSNGELIIIDTKGAYSSPKFANSSAYTFPVKQRMLFDKTGVYVNKVIPQSSWKKNTRTRAGFFSKTFVPDEVAYSKRNGERLKRYQDCITFNELIWEFK